MRKRILAFSVGLVLFLLVTQPVWADGIIIIDPPVDRELPPYLNVKYHHVTVTVEDQVAVTHVDQVFVNPHPYLVEGTYVFPLPEGATINDFSMWVDGERLSGEILAADQARSIYEDIVRRRRDPALLEYVGRNTFRARIFPIEPHAEKRVEIEYTEVLPLDGGLVRYLYPLDTERFSQEPIEDVSIHVEIHSREAIKAIYSPSHPIDIDHRGDYNASVGYEASDVRPDTDFQLYYTVAEKDVGLNLLSYAQEGEDGYFVMLLAPRVQVDDTEVVAKDVILVLDTSGSMRGEKIAQAQKALSFVLDNLNAPDRFNIITFSTGVRQFSDDLTDVGGREAAHRWVEKLEAKGGTNIHRAMLDALAQAKAERPTIVIFLTDGLATEGVVETEQILSDVDNAAPKNVRIFAFGVGDDVNTILLDSMSRDHRGTSAYVRPGQSIDEEVSAFYAKVSTPLLSDLRIDFGRVRVEDAYPYPLPDLFAGTQIVMVGRYRAGGSTTVTLRGTVNEQEQVFQFDDATFREEGGDEFIPRLWATRKIGYLLNQIRLHGESKELVEEIVDLSVRYGIMTPYTSFLVQEDVQVFSEEGRKQTAEREYSVMATATPAAPAGKVAVDSAEAQRALEESNTATGATGDVVKIVRDKVFLFREGIWIDTTFDADKMVPVKVGFMSEDYFALLRARPEWGTYLAVGEQVLVVLEGKAYQVVAEGEGQRIDIPEPKATPTVSATAMVRATPTAQVTPIGGKPTWTLTPRATGASNLTPMPVQPASPGTCKGTAVLLVAFLAVLWFVQRR